ncbi:MAG: ABC-type transport auxiliary lipoprotein family protein, partial [Candidatus Omnitrophica bacterium]|nr:ABC-type transport auxiliary lipoprotein family protein [Candidatus Omnitrophota bacterium]
CMQWSILDAREKKALLSKRSEYRKTVGNGNYAGLAGALSAICESLSRDIAQALIELGKKAPAGSL